MMNRQRWILLSAMVSMVAQGGLFAQSTRLYSSDTPLDDLQTPVPLAETATNPPPIIESEPAGDIQGTAMWMHPDSPDLSTILGADYGNGIRLYDLAGNLLQTVTDNGARDLDVAYGFDPTSGSTIEASLDGYAVSARAEHSGTDLVVYINGKNESLNFLTVDPGNGFLTRSGTFHVESSFGLSGICLFQHPGSGRHFVFVVSNTGTVRQYLLGLDPLGDIQPIYVRSFEVEGRGAGCAVDQDLALVYVASPGTGIWQHPADPASTRVPHLVDELYPYGSLLSDADDVAIYHGTDRDGYVLASTPDSNQVVIYERRHPNDWVVSLQIVAGNFIDGVQGVGGIDVSNQDLGGLFPFGALVVEDSVNEVGSNLKYVPWESVSDSAAPPLLIDPYWDPRKDPTDRINP